MKLVSFSVTNFRSITSANRLPIGSNTILIGPNNEGKSNLLQALNVGMAIIEMYSRLEMTRYRGSMRRAYRDLYSWELDYPITLQAEQPNGKSIFRLEFELDAEEVTDFYDEIKSTLNGTLPIELRIGKLEEPSFKVVKRGPGGPALSKKAEKIAKFLGSRIDFSYIPAVRTAEAASDVVSRMVARRLVSLENDPAYRAAIDKIQELQGPILDELSREVTETLQLFLSDVEEVTVSIPERARYRSYRRDCEIVVNDGTPTLLERKGDGVKSLAAIGLLYGSTPAKTASVLALEEPESHLHPKAIHTLKSILAELSERIQLVISTHNPLFVDRGNVRNNILVHNQSAKAAKNIGEIRELLGVRASDNLSHARLVLIVEGKGDKQALESIFRARSSDLEDALDGGDFVIDYLGGASKLA